MAKGVMSAGAVTTARRRKWRGVSTISTSTPPQLGADDGAWVLVTRRGWQTLHKPGDNLTLGGERQVDGDNASRCGFLQRGGLGLHLDGAGIGQLLQRNQQLHAVIQVHGVEQALNHRIAVRQVRRTQGGVDGGPAGTHQRIGGACVQCLPVQVAQRIARADTAVC